ncbi:MAG: hypothetical protein KDI19_16855 [Pseudomonadales bacterium]|nr:hypothetical protein [Pseudomonadales bacterium]
MRLILGILLSVLGLSALADDALPEPLENAEPNVIMAAGFGLMNLSDEEKAKFGGIIKQFTADVHQKVQNEARRPAPNLERRLARRVRLMFDDLDDRVKPVVNEERLAGYRIFKEGLYRQMQPSGKSPAEHLPYVDKGGGRPSAIQ